MSMEEVIDAQIGVLTLPYMAIPLRLKHRQRNRKKTDSRQRNIKQTEKQKANRQHTEKQKADRETESRKIADIEA